MVPAALLDDQAGAAQEVMGDDCTLVGVAASSVAWKMRTGGSSVLETSTGSRDFVGQNAQGALYQALFQVMNGAFSYTAQLSSRHSSQSRVQRASRHCTEA